MAAVPPPRGLETVVELPSVMELPTISMLNVPTVEELERQQQMRQLPPRS
jgi:hypothetical protein